MLKNRILVLTVSSILFFGCKSLKTDTTPGNNKDKTTVLVQKDLIKVGALITAYEMPYFNDHSVIYNPKDKKWHMIGISMIPSTELIHLTADSLTQVGWKKNKSFVYQGLEIWAPHIIYHEELYYMFYTSIGVFLVKYGIRSQVILTSGPILHQNHCLH